MPDIPTIEIEASASQMGNLVQFLLWISAKPRTYAETMEAWRTTCPRLSAWEDATANGLVDMTHEESSVRGEAVVVLTAKGRALLASEA
ncbi:hypothetical protein [Achromobacter deleyi]|uniref:hypothetical protein n=1 Tax=Achromobacter deleyi TaxID=1353891 RepID=UPI001F1E4E66|nr:hypothetical protein [Achromobacter deleyi]UIP23319.1 hypothetical protein LYZ39_12645 [Achromobacter deleyi]